MSPCSVRPLHSSGRRREGWIDIVEIHFDVKGEGGDLVPTVLESSDNIN